MTLALEALLAAPAGLALTPDRSGFWYLVGLDQLLHQLTYLLIIVYWFILW